MEPLLPGYQVGASLPDGSGIEDALRRNSQLGAQQAQKPKFNIGDFLLAWAGHLGDNLTGNPVYSKTLESRAAAEADARSAQAQKDWWYEQQRHQEERDRNKPPAIANDVSWLQGLPEAERQAAIEMIGVLRPQMTAPQMIPYGYEPVGGPPSGPGGDSIPTLSSPEQAASLPPGTRFRTPDGRIKIVPGGPTGSAPSGGFPGGY